MIGPAGRVDLTHVTGFESRQITHSLRVDRLDGSQIAAELPQGWEGTFEVERGSSSVDDFIAAAETAILRRQRVPPARSINTSRSRMARPARISSTVSCSSW